MGGGGEREDLKVSIEGKGVVGSLVSSAGHDTSLLVIGDTLLKKVGLALKGDQVHEIKGVLDIVVLGVTEGDQETISDKLDVLFHELSVHTDQHDGQGFGQEFLFDGHGLGDDGIDAFLVGTVAQEGEQEAGKVGVQPFVTGDEFVGEGETGHETTLLEPEDGGKSTREEDALDSGESDETFRKGGVLIRDPLEGPSSLFADCGDW